MPTYHLSYGAMADPFSKQLDTQTHVKILSRSVLAEIQKDHNAATRLYVRGLISDKQVQSIYLALSRQIAAILNDRKRA